MDTNTHSKLFTVLAINVDPAPSVHVHALDDTDSPFLHTKTSQCPPEHFLRHTVESFLKIDKREVERLLGCDLRLLQLANNEDGVCGASACSQLVEQFQDVNLCSTC